MENAINLNPSDTIRAIFPQSEKKMNALYGEAGNIISAIVTNKENGKTTLMTKDNILLQFPDDKIKADKGDEVFLEVISKNKKAISLKQVNIPYEKMQKHLLNQLDLKSLKELMQKSDFIQPEENVLSPKAMNENVQIEEKKIQAIKKVKRQIVYASNNVTQSAIAELVASGVSIEKISVNTMNAVIKEIAANPENRKNFQKTTYYNKNIMVDAYRKVDDIRHLNDGAIAKLIKSEKPITVKNIYIAKYSSKNSSPPMDEDTFEKLMPEIKKIMAHEGIDLSDKNIDLAKFFVCNEIPINKANIEKAEFLKNINSNIDFDYILNGALYMTQNGGEPFDFVIYGENKEYKIDWKELDQSYSSIMEDIPKISAKHIEILLRRNDPVTIKGLQNLLNKDVTKRKGQSGRLLFEEAKAEENVAPETFANKRYLAEIQLKLTWEAAVRLADKDIKIDTIPLQEAVDHLRAIENEKYIEILEASDAVASMENTSKMSELFNHVRRFMPFNYNAAHEIINHTVPFTIEGISAANVKAVERYENFAAHPNSKYGDTFNKIAEQIAPALESLGAESNAESIKAAEIMIKNNMELNIENLSEIKLINGKINEIYDRLNPMIAADMIKNGLNPSEMDIDEVISYIDNFNEIFGDNTIDKIAKYIKQMEDTKHVSKEERDSVIAVYRMLNHIQKGGNSVLGAVYKAHKRFTLGNLMESSKYLQKTKGIHPTVDKIVDDNHGEAAAIALSEELTIKDTLDITKEQAYYEYAFKRFGNFANGKTLEHLVSNNDFRDMDIETAMNELQTAYKDKNLEDKQLEQYMQRINNIADTSQSAIRFMENNNIPITLNNIEVTKNYMSDKKYFSNSFNKLRDSLRNREIDFNIDDLLPNTELYEIRQGDGSLGIGESFIERLDDIIADIDDPIVVEEIDIVKKIAVAMASSPWRTGNHYVPIIFGGKITEVDMYILNENIGQSEKIDMFISLDAGDLGEVNLLVKTNKDKVSLIISAKDETALQSLEDNTELLNDLIMESGFSIDNVRFQSGIQL